MKQGAGFSDAERCRELEDQLVRAEQRAFDRLQQISSTCEEVQGQYSDLLNSYHELHAECQSAMSKINDLTNQCASRQALLDETLERLIDLQAKLS